jgi:hypothetical protein
LEKVGIDARKVYLTNVVKHFKFEATGQASAAQEAERDGNVSLSSLAGR